MTTPIDSYFTSEEDEPMIIDDQGTEESSADADDAEKSGADADGVEKSGADADDAEKGENEENPEKSESESEESEESESEGSVMDWYEIDFVCPPKTPCSPKYLFESDREREWWENLPFRPESFLHHGKKEYYTTALKQNRYAISISIFTTDSWQMMERARSKRRDGGVFYGSSVPLKHIKGIHTIYTLDWNIETGRILGIGTIYDPTNTISSANTNGRSVRLYEAPYDRLNMYVYGGPRWTPRSQFLPETRPIIYALEQLIHERPFLPSLKKKDPITNLFISGGIKRLPIKYAIWLEDRIDPKREHLLIDILRKQTKNNK